MEVALAGFAAEFADFPDYILRITERIWEQRDVGAIREFYAADCIVHSGMGSSSGIDGVVAATLEKQYQFPDRLILGEDVIWCGTPQTGLLSSHRGVMTQTHAGFGSLGPPTGRRLVIRDIADCAAKDNQIYEEWLVVDMSSAIRQAGLDPAELSRHWAGQDEAKGLPTPAMSFSDARSGPDTRVLQDDAAARLVREVQTAIWSGRDLSVLERAYDRAVNLHLPGGIDEYGIAPYAAFLFGYLASFPDAVFRIEHSMVLREPERPVRVATRWTLTGSHAGTGTFGAPSVAPMFVLGIVHSELVGERIVREWVAIDETAIWRRIGRKLG